MSMSPEMTYRYTDGLRNPQIFKNGKDITVKDEKSIDINAAYRDVHRFEGFVKVAPI